MSQLQKYARWSEWEASVLSKVKDPQKCQKIILTRQRKVDDDQDEADLVAAHIREKLGKEKQKPDTCCVFIRTSLLAEWLTELKDGKMDQTKVTPYLKNLGVRELKRAPRKATGAGWVWRGRKAKKSAKPVDLEKIKCMPYDDA